MNATSYGDPEKMTVVKKRMDDRLKVEMVTNITIGVVILLVIALILTPFIYYVATVVPAQQQQWHDLRVECLAHHTVEACRELTGPAATNR
jgi:hypothetical protein